MFYFIMIIIPSRLEIVRSQNTKDSKNDWNFSIGYSKV